MQRVTSPHALPVVPLINQRMQQSGYGQLSSLDVSEFEPGCVRITGCVSSYYLKQVAQEAAMSVSGVEHVENGIRVASH